MALLIIWVAGEGRVFNVPESCVLGFDVAWIVVSKRTCRGSTTEMLGSPLRSEQCSNFESLRGL